MGYGNRAYGDGEFGDREDFRYGDDFGVHDSGARDQRLESFAQGRWGDSGAWGAGGRLAGWLALQAGDVSRPEVLGQATGDEVLGLGRAWKSLETWCFNGKLAVVRELIRRYPLNERGEPGPAGEPDAAGTGAGGLPDEWDPRLHHEVAAALGISVVAAGKLVTLAWTLDSRLRGISRVLDELRLDPPRVKMIVDETAVLDREDLYAKAEEIILAGLGRCKTWADLERLVQRAVITVDPAGAEKRRERAEREHARIRFWREAAGTCALRGTGLPTDQALAATANIEARALEYKAARVRRPMEILRVAAYLDLINGVSVAQRAAWAQAEDEARQANGEKAGADEQAARDAELREATRKAREKARRRNASPASPGHGADLGDASPGHGPDGDPGGDDPDGDDGGSSGGGFPGDWPPDDRGPDDEFGAEPGDGPLPDDPCASCRPGDCPCQDWDLAEPPSDEPTGTASYPDCGGGSGGIGPGIGLPVSANLTIPVATLEWLAEWSRHQTRGTGGGGGSSGGGGPGPCPARGDQGNGRVPVPRDLVLPLLTLLGLAQRPGEAHGLGALDPALARDLAATGARHPASEYCVTVVDDQGFAVGHGCCRPLRGKAGKAIPVDAERVAFTPLGRAGPDGGFGSWVLTVPGGPLPFTVDIDVVPVHECDHRYASAGYQPGGRLRHLVQVRDGACSFPPCSRHARESDFEHAIPHAKGGATCACNAHSCSRSCHRAKQSPGWQVTKPRPGWTRWTTMTGRTYLQGPWRYPALHVVVGEEDGMLDALRKMTNSASRGSGMASGSERMTSAARRRRSRAVRSKVNRASGCLVLCCRGSRCSQTGDKRWAAGLGLGGAAGGFAGDLGAAGHA